MKKIAIHIGLFSGVFFLFLVVFFPYDMVVGGVLDRQIAKNNIPVRYNTISAGLFRTTLYGVTVNYEGREIDFSDVYVKYTLFSVITRSIRGGLTSPYGSMSLRHRGDVLRADGVVNLFHVTKLFGQQAEGELTFNVVYDLKSKMGTFDIIGGGFAIQTPVIRLTGDSVEGNGTISDNIITITNLEAKGQSGVNANGRITLDRNNMRRSLINLSGEASIFGITSKFTVRGTLGDPQFALQ